MSGIIGSARSKSHVIGVEQNSIQPHFAVRAGSSLHNVTGNAVQYTILWDTVMSDPRSNYATGTGIYTAPVSGQYFFTSTFSLDCTDDGGPGSGAHTYIDAFLLTTGRTFQFYDFVTFANAGKNRMQYINIIADMDAGHEAKVDTTVQFGNADVSVTATGSFFGGWLIA